MSVLMSRPHPYIAAFRKAAEVFRRAGIRPAIVAAHREVSRQKLANAINSSRIFVVGTVSVPHLDAKNGVAVVQVNSLNGGGASLRVAADGYSLNGKPVGTASPHYKKFAAIERVLVAQQPRFGVPLHTHKLTNGR